MLSLNEELSEVQLLRLYERHFMHCLYFICEREFYARTHVKNYATLEINPYPVNPISTEITVIIAPIRSLLRVCC